MFGSCKSRFAARSLELCVRAIEGGLVAALVDHEEQVALADLAAFLKVHSLDVATDPRPHFDGLDRADATRELVGGPDLTRDDVRHTDFRGWRHCAVRRRILIVAGDRVDGAGHDGEHGDQPGGADKFLMKGHGGYSCRMHSCVHSVSPMCSFRCR